MPDKKISQLTAATVVNNDAIFPMVQEVGGQDETLKVAIGLIDDHVAVNKNYSSLTTSSKNIIGAINEVNSSANKTIMSSITTPAAVMTFNDGGDNIPVNKLLVAVTAQQAGSGTPSPDNVRAISGWSECKIIVADDNLMTQGTVIVTNQYNRVELTNTISSGNYNFSAKIESNDTDSTVCTVLFYYQDNTYLSVTDLPRNKRFSIPISLTKTVTAITFYASDTGAHGAGDTATWSGIQIESTSTQVTIPFGDTYYGAVLDVTNGKLTVTHGIVDLGDLTWVYRSENVAFYNEPIISDCAVNPTTCLCSAYEFNANANNTSVASISSNLSDLQMAAFSNAANSGRVVVKNSNYTDANAFKTAVTGQKLTYPLATPVVINLTPAQIATLSGLNNIYADCGDIQLLEYFNENADEIAKLIRAMS